MKKQEIKSSLLLLLTAVIWGVAFVAQRAGLDYVGPFTFNAARSILGGLMLLPCIRFLNKRGKDERGKGGFVNDERAGRKKDTKTLVIGGALCGVLLFAGSSLQQIGIAYTSVGKAGFITALYIVIVPVLSIFLRKKPGPFVWVSVAVACCGLYLLCVGEGFSIGRGDAIVLLGALAFSLHILVIDHFSPKVDGVRLSCIQFFVCGIIASVIMFLTERPEPEAILAAWLPISYAGILSCGVAYTLQIVGQRDLNPTVASLILSLESAVSVLAGWLLLGQLLTAREAAGCAFMMAAILFAQIPKTRRKRSAACVKP